jgi:nucleolar protein TMA23
MPFDSTTYLTTQGWEGKGIPLDGVGGAGLKKPIVIPRKDSFKGVGKDRDRAQAWWEDVYAVSS